MDLTENGVVYAPDYRQKVLDSCKTLEYLDGVNSEGQEAEVSSDEEDEEEGEEEMDGEGEGAINPEILD